MAPRLKPGDILLNKRNQEIVAIAKKLPSPGKADRGEWLFRCYCGNSFVTRRWEITSGIVSSCGCYRKEFQSPFKEGEQIINGTGKTITALHSNKDGTWNFRCYCGKTFTAQSSKVTGLSGYHNRILSCGCYKKSPHFLRSL